jgi:hypothetical protein
MTRSDKQVIAVALTPVAIYFVVMAAVFVANPRHFPGAAFGAGGGSVAVGSVAVANALRIYRERKRNA